MSCVSTPTATQFSTVVSSSVSTSFSQQITTLPGTTSTNLITSCVSSADLTLPGSSLSAGPGLGTCVSSTVITSTTVIDGGVSTTQVPFEITNTFTSTIPTNTLFAPCTDTTTPPTSSSSSTTTTSTPPTSTSSESSSTVFSQSSTTVVVTPTTTFTSSQDSTLSNGQVTQIIVTLTSALPPTSSVMSTSVPVATTQAKDNADGSSSSLGAIIGGTLGGFAGLLAIIGLIWFFRRRRVNFDEIFEKDYEEYTGKPITPSRGRMLDLEDEPVRPVEANTEPKPYVYGLVGSKNAVSPPSLNAGFVPAGNASHPSLASHGRSSSTTPLMNNLPASRPGSSGDSNHGISAGASGVSLSPSFTPSAAGGRSGSPGPLGVQIPTGPMFAEPYHPSGAESPTSMVGPRGPLFVANALDSDSPSGSRPGTPASPASPRAAPKRSSLAVTNAAGPSPSSPGPIAGSSHGPPPAAYAYLAEKQRLQRNDTVSSGSVYSQPSRAPTPPPSKARDVQPQRTSAGVVVHTDAGRVPPTPPAYR